jgi:hypothetical protein
MSTLRKDGTLFDAVPALGAVSAHGPGTAKLVPLGFAHPGFALAEGVNKLGRDPGQNHHVILSSHVSRTHCEVVVSSGKILVRDLGSHNGTYVNSTRVKEKELQPGDKVGLSRRVTFVLVMDAELQKPIGMDLKLDATGGWPAQASPAPGVSAPRHDPFAPPSSIRPGPGPTTEVRPIGWIERGGSAHVTPELGEALAPPPPTGVGSIHLVSAEDDGEPDAAAQLKQMEQQRNVLAILYQISLRCLMADSQKDVEKLLTNVLGRLVPLDAGFILYQVGDHWRATICPNAKQRPGDDTVRTLFRLAVQQRAPLVVKDPRDLEPLGLQGGSAVAVPLILGDEVRGVVGAISSQSEVYDAEAVDILMQLATVCAAAFRERPAP